MKHGAASDVICRVLLAQSSPWEHPWTPNWTGSFWIPVGLALGGIVIVAICYLREMPGVSWTRRALYTLLRSAAILLLMWMMLGWTWIPYAEEPADLVFLIDASRSMQTEDVIQSKPGAPRNGEKKPISRAAAAKSLLLSSQKPGLLERVSEEYRPRVGYFGGETGWLASDPVKQRQEIQALTSDAPATRLGDAILDALRYQRGRGAAAIVIVSDGVQTDGAAQSSAAAAAKSMGSPLFVIGLGEDRPPRDVRITQVVYSRSVFLGDVVYIEVNLEAEGFSEISPLVTLKDAKSGEPLASESVVMRGNASSRVRLPVRPTELGEWKFAIEVEKPPSDANPENNLASGTIRVQEDTVRVLVVDRRPRYDIRYLTDVLSRARKRHEKTEPAFALKTYLQEGDAGLSRQDPAALDAFPPREELAKYDVIILGDIDPRLLGVAAQRDLLEVTTRGGVGLALLPSAQQGVVRWIDQPLELLLPARPNEMATQAELDAAHPVTLAALGRQTPFCMLGEKPSQMDRAWRTLPPLFGLLAAARLPKEVRVIVESSDLKSHDGRPAPIVTTHFVGASQVLCHWTDEWWRWAGPSSRTHYEQYWMQAVRSLCSQKPTSGDELFDLRSDATRYTEGQAVRLTLHFRDERLASGDELGPVVSLRSEDVARDLVLSRDEYRRDLFHGSAGNLPAGAYVATVVRPPVLNTQKTECRFEIEAQANEAARLRPDFSSLRLLAEQSGGKFYTAETAAQLPRDLPSGEVMRTSPLAPRAAWNLPVFAACLIGLLGFEWFLRRTGGLL